MEVKIKDLVAKDMLCAFDSYRAGFFYYNLYNINQTPKGDTHQFTIPADDIGNATLNRVEKAITCMRWIRKAMESDTLIEIKKT